MIFTSDNGGPLNHDANNHPLRGGKTQILEGGVRVCTLAWWPGRIPGGGATSAITSMMDILPTFAKLAGTSTPGDRKIDGVDIWPVLAGAEKGAAPRDEFLYFRGFSLEAVRAGAWKLHLASGELYNLEDDIGESRNRAAEQPQIVAKLRQQADATRTDLGLDGVGPGCRQLGRVTNPRPLIDFEGNVRSEFSALYKRLP